MDPEYAAQDLAWVSLLIITLVLSLATLTVGLRFYTRIFLIKQLGWDDYCVLFALVCWFKALSNKVSRISRLTLHIARLSSDGWSRIVK